MQEANILPSFADKLKDGKTLLGLWVQIPHPEIVEITGYSGYDFVIIDMEHGHFGFEMVESMVRGAEVSGMAPLVRIPENNEALIMKVLDTGAVGVVVPSISTKEATTRIVSAAKYYPLGNRGACPCVRAAKHSAINWQDHSKRANKTTVVLPLIESIEGVNNYRDIITVEGIGGFLLGPFDLSVALGVNGDVKHPIVQEKLDEVTTYAAQNGVPFITTIFNTDPEKAAKQVQDSYKKGCRAFALGIDKQFFAYSTSILNKEVRDTLLQMK